MCIFSILSSMLCEFSFKLANIKFLEAMTDVLGVHFLSAHSVYIHTYEYKHTYIKNI